MDDDNIIKIKSKAFAIRIINLYKYLTNNAPIKEYVMSKQALRSGTSIGANVKEALRGQSKADFRAKMNIALKEASETEYWLELLFETDFISEDQYNSIYTDNLELIKILKDMGVRKGVPDLCLFVPKKGKQGLFIEMKAPNKYPRPEQRAMMQTLEEEGYQCAVCHSLDEFRDIIDNYLI
mgnify:CR=1 FL=1